MAEALTASSNLAPFQTEAEEKNNKIADLGTNLDIQSLESFSASQAVQQQTEITNTTLFPAVAADPKNFVTQSPLLPTVSNTTPTENNNKITAVAADAEKVVMQSEASPAPKVPSIQTNEDTNNDFAVAVANSKNLVIRSPVASASAKTTNVPADAANKLNTNKTTIAVPSVPPTMPVLTECNECGGRLNMNVLLPPQKCYPTRRSAVEAAKLAVVRVNS